jgi:hypothetical protein
METLSFNGYLHSNPKAMETFQDVLSEIMEHCDTIKNAPEDPDNADNGEVDQEIEDRIELILDRVGELKELMNEAFCEMFKLRINTLENTSYQDSSAVKAAMDERIRLQKFVELLDVPIRIGFARSFQDAERDINVKEKKAKAKASRAARKAI